MSNHSRLYEEVFHTDSDKVSVRSTEVFDLDVQLGFKGPDILEVLKVGKGETHVYLTLSEEDIRC